MNSPPFTITNDSISVVWEGKPYVVQKGSPQFITLKEALLSEKWDLVPKNITVAKSLTEWTKGKFTVKDNQIFYDKDALPVDLNTRILEMASKGEDPTPLFNFWERLKNNPSYRSVNQLWGFLQHQGIPITQNGRFLAYKSVQDNYKDFHSGTIDNKPGKINEMPRNKISDDPRVECHEGLHVGSLEYAGSFEPGKNQRIVIVEVDPADVVCVPYDHSQQKMRVCKYKVVGNHNGSYLPSTTIEDEFKETKPKSKKRDPSKYNSEYFRKLNKMGTKDLMGESLDDLRQYAGKSLRIVGASKIPGGKVALITKILKVRK